MTRGSLYFIQEGGDGCIKIGWTAKALERRVHSLQIGNSQKLTLLASIPEVEPKIEREWHKRFADARCRGEWFYPSRVLLAAIEKAGTAYKRPARKNAFDPEFVHKPHRVAPNMLPLADWMKKHRLRQVQFAPKIGVASCSLSQMLNGKRGLHASVAKRIELATGGAVKASVLLGLSEAA